MSAVFAWLGQKLSGAWVVIAGVAVALVAGLAIVAKLLSAGRAQERADASTRIIKDVEKRHEVEADVAREPDPAGRLRDRWSRD